MASRSKNAEGDWICSDSKCANLNFARRSSCNRCGKEKEIMSEAARKKQGIEIGKAAAEKSHGLFSADDWQCTKCGNVNWARRQTCNMCNAPKVGEVEERTGYGGGFNERIGVEYVKREDSDDEFDEFGRKKKKFRKPDTVVPKKEEPKKEPTSSVNNVNEEEDEEEEEDEDDDGDLSKYDLWGDDDDDVGAAAAAAADDDDEQVDSSKDKTQTRNGNGDLYSGEKGRNSTSPRPFGKTHSPTRSSSHSSKSSRSSLSSPRAHSHSKDRSPDSRSRSDSPWTKARHARSRSRDRSRRKRSHGSRSSYSRSRSRSRSRSHSKDGKQYRK